MTPFMIGSLGLVILIIMLFFGVYIGVVMMVVGGVGMWLLSGWPAAWMMLETVPFASLTEYNMTVVPLFILMGAFCFHAGISNDLYNTIYKWLGHLRGGLAMATIGACAGFAALSGSSLATAATMGTVALPEMRRYKYDNALATGAIAAGGSIGILIPPSVPLILYGYLANQSIGKLFIAGIVPGLMQTVIYMIVIGLLCWRKPEMGPRGPKTTMVEKIVSLKSAWVVALLFVLVIGGIYTGIFSPTEAAGVGALGAFLFALFTRKLTKKNFGQSVSSTIQNTSMIFLIFVGAMVFGYFLGATRMPHELASMVGGLPVNRYVILIVVLMIYVVLGCFLDSLAMILITVPIFFPLVVQSLGFDAIWFGIIVVKVVEIGLITPPVGINVFVIKGIASDVPMGTIFRGIIPFLTGDVIQVALLIMFPQIVTFLPGIMK